MTDVYQYAIIVQNERLLNLENIYQRILNYDVDFINKVFCEKYPLFIKPNISLAQVIQRYLEKRIAPDYSFGSCLEEFMDEIS